MTPEKLRECVKYLRERLAALDEDLVRKSNTFEETFFKLRQTQQLALDTILLVLDTLEGTIATPDASRDGPSRFMRVGDGEVLLTDSGPSQGVEGPTATPGEGLTGGEHGP